MPAGLSTTRIERQDARIAGFLESIGNRYLAKFRFPEGQLPRPGQIRG